MYNMVLANHRYIELIIIPKSLRRSLFIHLHNEPSGGYMVEYKTIYTMRLRLFWPKLRDDVKQWVKFRRTEYHTTLG